MRRKHTLLLIALFFGIGLYAQSKKGKVLDIETRETLAYVNIISENHALKLISDQNGSFQTDQFNQLKANDKVFFYASGYEKKEIPVAEILKDNFIIYLHPTIVSLEEAVLTNQSFKSIIGNKELGRISSKFITAYDPRNFDELGKEKGIIFNIENETRFDHFSFYVVQNEFKSVKLKLNFYTYSDGEILELLNHEDIFIEVNNGYKGWVNKDLKDFDLLFEKQEHKVIAVLQWLQSEKYNDESEKFGINSKKSKQKNQIHYWGNAHDAGWKVSKYDLVFYFDVTVFK